MGQECLLTADAGMGVGDEDGGWGMGREAEAAVSTALGVGAEPGLFSGASQAFLWLTAGQLLLLLTTNNLLVTSMASAMKEPGLSPVPSSLVHLAPSHCGSRGSCPQKAVDRCGDRGTGYKRPQINTSSASFYKLHLSHQPDLPALLVLRE